MQSNALKHGYSGRRDRTYATWISMRSRCRKPRSSNYRNYGGRGIKVCDRWQSSFEKFLADMGERPEGHTIDRIDVNGDYCKENCRWSTDLEQHHNRRDNKLSHESVKEILHMSKEGFTQSEIAKKFSVNQSTVSRILSGKRWPTKSEKEG